MKRLRFDASHALIVDFSVDESAAAAVTACKDRIVNFVRESGVQSVEVLQLGPSTDYKRNANLLTTALQQIVGEAKRKKEVDNRELTDRHRQPWRGRLFCEISVLPKVYIQIVIAASLKMGLFPSTTFGYCQAEYPSSDGKADFSHGKADIAAVPHLYSSEGMTEEKTMVACLGGEEEVFYRVTDEQNPDQIRLIVPRNRTYPAIEDLLDRQVGRARESFRLADTDIADVPAFSAVAHLKALDDFSRQSQPRGSLGVFVGGPKPQAIASAVFACIDPRAYVTARVPNRYQVREVLPAKPYWLYNILDLTAPELATLGSI